MLGLRSMFRVGALSLGVLVGCLPTVTPRADHVPARPIPYPTSMAALGDSITQAFDSLGYGGILQAEPQYSWATGSANAARRQPVPPAARGGPEDKGPRAQLLRHRREDERPRRTGGASCGTTGRLRRDPDGRERRVHADERRDDPCRDVRECSREISQLSSMACPREHTSSCRRSRTCCSSGRSSTPTRQRDRDGLSASASRCSRLPIRPRTEL